MKKAPPLAPSQQMSREEPLCSHLQTATPGSPTRPGACTGPGSALSKHLHSQAHPPCPATVVWLLHYLLPHLDFDTQLPAYAWLVGPAWGAHLPPRSQYTSHPEGNIDQRGKGLGPVLPAGRGLDLELGDTSGPVCPLAGQPFSACFPSHEMGLTTTALETPPASVWITQTNTAQAVGWLHFEGWAGYTLRDKECGHA